MGGRFSFEVEAGGGQADVALRRLLQLLRDTAEAGLRDLDEQQQVVEPGRPRLIPLSDPEGDG
jgi:hypothetical protein